MFHVHFKVAVFLLYQSSFHSSFSGDDLPALPQQSNAYIYSDYYPKAFITSISINYTDVAFKRPLNYTIYKVETINQTSKDSYWEAFAFLLTSGKSPGLLQQDTCRPSIRRDYQFCIYSKHGYLFTSATFVPGLNSGKTFLVSILVEDSSTIPKLYSTNVTVNVVTACYPVLELYRKVRENCPTNVRKFLFPSNAIWSRSSHSSLFPLNVTGPISLTALYVDTSLLVGFNTSLSELKLYNITLQFNGQSKTLAFEYHGSDTSVERSVAPVRATGIKFNVTLLPPIKIEEEGPFIVKIYLTYLRDRMLRMIHANTKSAFRLYGVPLLEKCPGTDCYENFIPWADMLKRLRRSSKYSCIKDDDFQETYVQQCHAHGKHFILFSQRLQDRLQTYLTAIVCSY